jgi:GTP-binding protein
VYKQLFWRMIANVRNGIMAASSKIEVFQEMFLDEVRIHLASGKGGDGVVHFRREKYVPRGGPDGGEGGRGGSILFQVDPHLNSLTPFRRQRHYKAEDGRPGGSSNKTGADGADLVLHVPPGTQVRAERGGDLIADLVQAGEQVVILPGGRGGRGNARYATSRNQAPYMAEKGEPGQERWVYLELKLIADIGIIGLPNAGKSTFLAAVTNAQPKIADYPFTTLQPNLGVADIDGETTLVLADIPGLIEGAHEGVGLGSQFLRHIQRTRVLIHMLDGAAEDPVADFSQVNAELALFDPELAQKPQIVALNKTDLPEASARVQELSERFKANGHLVHPISALARQGLRELLYAAKQALDNAELAPAPDEEVPVYRFEEKPAFVIERDPDGAWRLSGAAIERAAAMTYWQYDEAVRRFQRMLNTLGIEDALREAGVESGDTVRIGENELEWLT